MLNPFLDRLDPQARLRALYDAAASRWQSGLDRLGYPAAYADFMSRALSGASAGSVALDVGTGTGAFATAWATQAGHADRLDLLDISLPMLEEARSRLAWSAEQVETIHMPLGAPGLPDSVYDTVLCAHVVEHLPDPAAAIDWLAARLRPGGRLLLAVSRPHWCTMLLRLRWGNASIHPDRVTILLQDAGLEDITILPFAAGPPRRTSCGFTARRPRPAVGGTRPLEGVLSDILRRGDLP